MPKAIVYKEGQQVGKMTFVKDVPSPKGKARRAIFKCNHCDNEIECTINNVVSENTTSCRCTAANFKDFGMAAMRDLYTSYRHGATRRGHTFELTEEQFIQLTSQRCYYCNTPPAHKHTHGGRHEYYNYNGIDRKNNEIGYVVSNCVPCCKICNIAKADLTEEQFVAWIYKVYNNLAKR